MFPHTAFIALGANLGDRKTSLDVALAILASHKELRVEAVSLFVETVAVGGPPDQPKYLNAAAKIETSLTPRDLLNLLLHTEEELGRVRHSNERNVPRTLDLDLLLFDDQILDEPGLQIPHPRMHQRRFVLEPLADIAPTVLHPRLNRTIRELLSET